MKADFLKECLTDLTAKVKKSIPIDQFNSEYCMYCQNRDCSRSGAENRLFNVRTSNWKYNLFENVPRALPDDPNYEPIRAKWFKPPQVIINPQPDPPKEQEEKVFLPPPPDDMNTELEASGTEELMINPEEESVQEPSKVHSKEPIVPAKKVINNQNTSWDADEYVDEKKDQDVVISPGGSFTFGG